MACEWIQQEAGKGKSRLRIKEPSNIVTDVDRERLTIQKAAPYLRNPVCPNANLVAVES